MALDVHIVVHTHWDREWYHPLERFRQRLVALIDELLDDDALASPSVLLDGQAILLEDYLAVRPDRIDDVRDRLQTGVFEAGPWYVLADELIPSGEALVRNLLAGRRTLARLGASPPPVLYCPDSFGHPAALPALARGFGLELIVLWRGYGGRRWPSGDTVRWAAPDGESVLLFHLPRDGYEFGSHVPWEIDGARLRWERMRDELAPRSATGVLLVPNGADHHAPQRHLAEALDALARVSGDDDVRRSSLRRFAAALIERASDESLPFVRGELRDSYGYTWTLQGTFATRAHEKRLNARVERLLEREAEPWSAFAARLGRSRRALIDSAWRSVLAAHPHDTLCGCSIDDVATAMEGRLRGARHEGRGIRDDAILDLIGHDPVEARTARDQWRPLVLIRNAAARPRAGVAIIDVDRFLADVPVGPSSAGQPVVRRELPRKAPRVPGLGKLQVLSERERFSRTESPRHYPDNDLVRSSRVAAWVANVPAYGIAAFPIDDGATAHTGPRSRVIVEPSVMRNGELRLEVDDDGVVSLEQLATGRRIARLFEFSDEEDLGDLYTPAPRPRPFTVRFRRLRRVHRGPLRGEWALHYRIADAASPRDARVDIAVHLILDADAPFVRVEVHGDNRRENHRLRIAFHTDVSSPAVWADAAFGPVRRVPIVVDPADAAMEQPPPTAPLHRYVSLFDETSGATIYGDGLAEYEARDADVLVTLVRAVGELSRNDLPERPGHAGWPAPTPGAQCLGSFSAAFALLLHGPRIPATVDRIERVADDVLLPLVGETLRSALAVPAPVAGPELIGEGLAFSAFKESEDGEWLVARCFNLLDQPVAGAWRLPFEIREAAIARLDETVLERLEPDGDTVRFTAGPRAMVTVLLR